MGSLNFIKNFIVITIILDDLTAAKPFILFRSFLIKTSPSNNEERRITQFGTSYRGGSVSIEEHESQNDQSARISDSLNVIVSTNIGSSFLDKKKKLILSRNSTVKDIKNQLHLKFPGSPPVSIQNLFFGLRLLHDDDIIGNLTTNSNAPVPLVLDVITGTSSYNKTLTVSQALEAYASLSVHQSYLGQQFKLMFEKQQQQHQETGNESIYMSLSIYQDILDSINASLYAKYSEDISEALDREREPEVLTADTAAWRQTNPSIAINRSPLAVILAKEFDLNTRVVRFFIYYSVLLGFFAVFGTVSSISKNLLLLCVPALWAFRLRQLRLFSKIGLHLILPIMPNLDFLMPLLPAPYQVMAQQSKIWLDNASTSEEILVDEENLFVNDNDEENLPLQEDVDNNYEQQDDIDSWPDEDEEERNYDMEEDNEM